MRIMIAVVAIMVASVLSIALMQPSGAGQPGAVDKIEASIKTPAAR
jgi:hypothetical protein